jgi:hypothetical protein
VPSAFDAPAQRLEATTLPPAAAQAPGVAAGPVPAASRALRLFDFGREVTGYLGLRFGAEEVRLGCLCIGRQPPLSCGLAADGYVLAPAGAPEWEDAVVRRLRYAAVLGPGDGLAAYLLPVDAGLAAALPAPPAGERGLLGIEPPPRPTPLEREVERRLRVEAAGALE